MQDVLQLLPDACGKPLSDLDAQARERLAAFQARAGQSPLWTSSIQVTELLDELAALVDDGLSPATYHPDAIRLSLFDGRSSALQRTCGDLLASHGYLLALQHLAQGRLPQSLYEPVWRSADAPLRLNDEALLAIATENLATPRQAFQQARPPLEQYHNLRKAYVRLRDAERNEPTEIPSGQTLRPGMTDPRLPLLRHRLRDEGYLPEEHIQTADARLYYGSPEEAALKAFQRDHGLQDDGVLGQATLAMLNLTPEQRLDRLRVNLERFRWLSQDIEPESLLVDIAGGRVLYFHQGQVVWETRAQVGRSTRQTPVIRSRVTRLTLNPTWTVPPTILREDKLPKIRANPGYLAEQSLQVLDYQGNPIDPRLVDWNRPGNILLRQAAGPDNPLGRLVIRFANPYSIYLHDTPSQNLFGRAQRAVSSGCVRVESVMQLADFLLAEHERERFTRRLESGQTHEFRLSRSMPILLAYWTAEADSSGLPRFRPDIYQHDRQLLTALQATDPVVYSHRSADRRLWRLP